ncbi:DUF2851 family protein [Dyadobacter sp. CY323]|uniref:DUF2851 family protein n=1 Tax=Dyadobacter sp. CY323 TaxID=2907302 RepID=UPI001F3C198F|nr:DUF2851 family protein [Dyadobacter sp. CY323]MCE6989486.1 DUF2851 family protein [Dyadobacter sp. CY323]
MNEDILSFVWRFQYFNTANLRTDSNQRLSVMRTGYKNVNAGPDFSEAGIIIDDVNWHGSIEIHVRSSDWFLHTHEKDQAYEGVILHVVWENDKPVIRRDGTLIPTLTLKGLVKQSVLERYAALQDVKEGIPCKEMFHEVMGIHKFDMLDKVLLERLERKGKEVMQLLENNQNDWEKTAYQWLGKHFGFKLNDHAFLRLMEITPWKVIQKHRGNSAQIEALLFGMAGLIPDDSDEIYVRQLKKEFQFLSKKYNLTGQRMHAHEWKYAKLRPAGFPTVRLAQLAKLLSKEGSMFLKLTSPGSIADLQEIFHGMQSEYWTEHYIFCKKSKNKVPAMGKDASALLVINAVVPLLVAFSKHRQQPELLDKAIYWLSQVPAENNRITREWETLEMRVKTAADSQALIEWYNNYCTFHLCLNCTVGAALVRSS